MCIYLSSTALKLESRRSLGRFPTAGFSKLFDFCSGGLTRALLPHMDSLHICQLESRPCFLGALCILFSFPCLSIFRYQETKVTDILDRRRCNHANIYQEVKQKDTRHTRSHQSLPSRDYGRICVYIILYYTYISSIQNVPTLIRLIKNS